MRDAETIDAIKDVLDGNPDSFRLLLREYSLPIRSYLASRVYVRDDAEDVAQDVFITAFKNLSQFRQDENFRSWLFGIAGNKLLHYYRAKKRRTSAHERYQAAVWEEVSERVTEIAADTPTERIELLVHCIEKLPLKLRRIVRLGLNEEKSESVAEEMKISIGSLYTMRWRAMGILRECISENQ